MIIHIRRCVLVICPCTIRFHVYSRAYAAIIQEIYHLFLVELSFIDSVLTFCHRPAYVCKYVYIKLVVMTKDPYCCR